MIFKCGTVSKLLWYPFLMPIFLFIRIYISLERNTDKLKKTSAIVFIYDYDSPFFFSLISMMIYLLGGLLDLISIWNFKHKNLEQTNKKTVVFELIQYKEDNANTKRTKYYLLIFFASLFLSLCFVLSFILSSKAIDSNFYTNMRVSLLFFDLLFSVALLRYPIYRHQILSIIFMMGGLLMVSISVVTQLGYQWELFLVCFCNYIFYAAGDCLVKILSYDRYNGIFKIMFHIGLISSIGLIIVLSFTWVIPCTTKIFFNCINNVVDNGFFTLTNYFSQEPLRQGLLFVGYIIVHFGYTVCLFQTLNHFSPLHRCMADSICVLIAWFVQLRTVTFDGLALIGYILITISSLIYNELIILNFWSLNEYTKSEIIKRSQRDSRLVEIENLNVELIDFGN